MEKSFPDYLKRYLPENRINSDNLQSLQYEGLQYFRLKKDISGYPRGTVFTEGALVQGYQRIKRILALKEGIRRYIKGEFYVEEKMDGYNVRIKRIKDRVYTFTRGGFICPFTMDRLEDFISLSFFERYPDLTLCAEVVGPENPYNSEPAPYIKEDIAFFVFDVKDPAGRSLPLPERYSIYEDQSLNSVKRWGPFTLKDTEKIKDIIRELDSLQREGIVIKDIHAREELKYVTPGSCIRDIRATAHLIPEIPGGFYIQRLIRLAMTLREFGIPLSESLFGETGRALLEPLNESLEAVENAEKIKEVFRIRVNRKETIDRLFHHLKKTGISAKLISVEKEKDKYRVTFTRTFPKGTKLLRRALRGYGFYD